MKLARTLPTIAAPITYTAMIHSSPPSMPPFQYTYRTRADTEYVKQDDHPDRSAYSDSRRNLITKKVRRVHGDNDRHGIDRQSLWRWTGRRATQVSHHGGGGRIHGYVDQNPVRRLVVLC